MPQRGIYANIELEVFKHVFFFFPSYQERHPAGQALPARGEVLAVFPHHVVLRCSCAALKICHYCLSGAEQGKVSAKQEC